MNTPLLLLRHPQAENRVNTLSRQVFCDNVFAYKTTLTLVATCKRAVSKHLEERHRILFQQKQCNLQVHTLQENATLQSRDDENQDGFEDLC